ncbi:hypothetical protein [Luteolibacter marinus]|uniref:hypothetical protein n=1 Tax=Luteolibacter marinus TaxID=2776705 RepID=UPI0018667048|nr:hypothetical protein [Luteolibacter marinus]
METATPTLPEELSPILASSRLGTTPLTWIPATSVVPPFDRLLVHDHDMTSELARFHGDSIALQIHRALHQDGTYLREVTLHAAASGEPVEYGLIEILLDSFTAQLRPRILAGDTPLGAILNESGLPYGSEPQGFFTVPVDSLHGTFPRSAGGEILYGRYNHLISRDGPCLARILEILPTVP